ncbi:hypothetical protein [Chelatococcus composti]|jgi:hypothetical protein|uniref:Flagellar assembly protein FliH/Type III secretion system HrpE domain-containing protein n=1 Tax=Chelatococcus composti TaxID=1743235 RepID=A0A841K4C8_9HYPH|nr:hypothetical protein [Chelatococcus composti]MBB6167628.1 hypothetical protein [Chelatococcus composti]MBS7735171.1 hypothetical protein [Chelatococcus composti]PZN45125.1 MAG: hypothetical protein DIU59_02660 [Pseudomonadota bacterium]GGG37224.1 hypothetical protein GCM10008026_17570 [Chelatococcus composti]
MPRPPLVSLLVDFNAEERRLSQPAPRRAGAPPSQSLVQPPARDAEVQIAQALEKGRNEGWAAAEAAWEEKLRVEREQFQQQLAAARAEWARNEGQVLAEAIHVAFNAMQSRLSTALARTLTPFLEQAQRERALAALADAVRTLAETTQHELIEISAADDLAAALAGHLGDLAAAVRFVPGTGPDVRVVADDTVIETRLAEWAAELAAVVGQDAS